jgi:hypothetical protein
VPAGTGLATECRRRRELADIHADNLLLLDCRSFDSLQVPFHRPDLLVVVTNSNVRHSLDDGGYAARRADCERAAAILGVAGGFVAALAGVGGGILFVPALVLVLGLSQVVAEATSLLAIVPVAILGTWQQRALHTTQVVQDGGGGLSAKAE